MIISCEYRVPAAGILTCRSCATGYRDSINDVEFVQNGCTPGSLEGKQQLKSNVTEELQCNVHSLINKSNRVDARLCVLGSKRRHSLPTTDKQTPNHRTICALLTYFIQYFVQIDVLLRN